MAKARVTVDRFGNEVGEGSADSAYIFDREDEGLVAMREAGAANPENPKGRNARAAETPRK